MRASLDCPGESPEYRGKKYDHGNSQPGHCAKISNRNKDKCSNEMKQHRWQPVCPGQWLIRARRAFARISILLLLAILCSCDLPSDHSLRTRFSQKKAQFDRIHQMIDEDNLDGRIHADYADPKLPAVRLEQYRSLLRDAGLTRLWANGKSKPFELVADGTGFLSQGDYKGYLYDPSPQDPTLPSLDDSCFLTEQIPDSRRFCRGVLSLGNGWWVIRYEYR